MTQEQIAYNNNYIHRLAFKELNRLTEGRLREKEIVIQQVKIRGKRKCVKCGEWMEIKDVHRYKVRCYCGKCIRIIKFE